MAKKILYRRWQMPLIKKAMQTRRVLLLSGPRQSGKTTLAKQLISKNREYRTLDDTTMFQAAQTDPQDFVKHSRQTLIIDEVQRVPALLSAIKKVVDEDNRPGQYLLTGSANIQSLPGVTESLAGRIRKIRLRPLTQGEILGKLPKFLEQAFKQSFLFAQKYAHYDKEAILKMTFRGGFPEAIRLEPRERKNWYKDYIESLLERDLQDIANIRRKESMRKLLKVLAAWSSKFMDISAIGSGLSLQRHTIESYINALETLYLVEQLHPWASTDYARIAKHSKLFMTDCGLMSSLLGWRMEQIRLDGDKVGKMMETFIFNELAAQVEASNQAFELFHYRDREQREIDFLVENEDGDLLGIEVKASSTVTKDNFKHIRWFKENLATKRSFIGIVLYTGELPLSFGDNMWSIPIGMLWS